MLLEDQHICTNLQAQIQTSYFTFLLWYTKPLAGHEVSVNYALRVPTELPAKGAQLIKQLLSLNPSDRPSANEVVGRLEALHPEFNHRNAPLPLLATCPST